VDGGANWTTLPLSPVQPGQLVGLRFADATTGTAFDEGSGLLSRTTDGGQTWNVLSPPPTPPPPLPVWKPTPGGIVAEVVMLSGSAQIEAGAAHSAARSGETLSSADTLVLEPGATAEVGLPDGSTVLMAPVTGTFRFTGAQPHAVGVVIRGTATVTVVPGTSLTVLCGAGVLRSTGPSTFTVSVAPGNYPDTTVSVSIGTVTGTPSEGGPSFALTAGQQDTMRVPRGH
jgi:hypothetical protein